MAELRALRYALTRAGVTWDIEVESFVGKVFASVGDIENIKTLSQLFLKFKSIRSGGWLQPGDITLSITASVSIEAIYLWINDRRKKNQSQTGGNFNQEKRDEFHEIYRDIQERADAKHEN